jgi:hypothetical protein
MALNRLARAGALPSSQRRQAAATTSPPTPRAEATAADLRAGEPIVPALAAGDRHAGQPIAPGMAAGDRRAGGLIAPAVAAARLSVTAETLERWRGAGQGPRFVKLTNKTIRYRPEDLEAFIAHVQASTATA